MKPAPKLTARVSNTRLPLLIKGTRARRKPPLAIEIFGMGWILTPLSMASSARSKTCPSEARLKKYPTCLTTIVPNFFRLRHWQLDFMAGVLRTGFGRFPK